MLLAETVGLTNRIIKVSEFSINLDFAFELQVYAEVPAGRRPET